MNGGYAKHFFFTLKKVSFFLQAKRKRNQCLLKNTYIWFNSYSVSEAICHFTATLRFSPFS